MSNTNCDHNWVKRFDSAPDTACYNDGLYYYPAKYICTKCGKTKKIKYDNGMKWYDYFLMIPLSGAVLLYLFTIAPVLMLIGFIRDEFSSKERG
jgi:hypothetical protein